MNLSIQITKRNGFSSLENSNLLWYSAHCLRMAVRLSNWYSQEKKSVSGNIFGIEVQWKFNERDGWTILALIERTPGKLDEVDPYPFLLWLYRNNIRSEENIGRQGVPSLLSTPLPQSIFYLRFFCYYEPFYPDNQQKLGFCGSSSRQPSTFEATWYYGKNVKGTNYKQSFCPLLEEYGKRGRGGITC